MKHIRRWLALAALAAFPAVASAKEYQNKWWLPSDYSTHGYQIDALFTWIFWITTITFIAVQVVLAIFLVKYRHNPNKKKAVFIYGGNWLADPLSPAGLSASGRYGTSSNQQLLTESGAQQLRPDDVVFFRPRQSEAVLQQFGDIAVFDQGKIADMWQVFPATG